MKETMFSVTNFLYYKDNYLFIKRGVDRKIDPGKLNGIDGKVDPGEDFISAAIRETEEETGYKVTTSQIMLSSIIKLEGGYDDDWMMCFFKIKVDDMSIPLGNKVREGELLWLHKDDVLSSKYELVDDLRYTFKDVVEGKHILFMHAALDSNQKIIKTKVSRLKLPQ